MLARILRKLVDPTNIGANNAATNHGAAACETMISRFQGADGRRRLITALMHQEVIEHNEALATKIADIGTLDCIPAGTDFIVQGGRDNDIYFVISGEADIYANGHPVAIRDHRHCVGEMSLLDPSKPRAATVRARTELVYVRISEAEFQKVGRPHPLIWKAIAKMLAERLRQRNIFHRPPNPKPVLFIGSSTEAIPLVKAIEAALAPEDIALRPWYEGVFEPSSMTLDTLITHAQEADFAVFVFGPDDHIVSRATELKGPRDNVVFELGLFMGRLERKRTFVISGPMELKIPSDLAGLTHIRIPKEFASSLVDAAPGIASEIIKAVKKHGCR